MDLCSGKLLLQGSESSLALICHAEHHLLPCQPVEWLCNLWDKSPIVRTQSNELTVSTSRVGLQIF